MRLDEIMNSIVPYEWTNTGEDRSPTAEFKIGNVLYAVTFGKYQSATTVVFDADWGSGTRYEMTKTGNEFAVMSTVIAIMKDYVAENDPEVIKFSAKEPSRINVYLSLAKKMAKDYDIEHFHTGHEEIFRLTKK